MGDMLTRETGEAISNDAFVCPTVLGKGFGPELAQQLTLIFHRLYSSVAPIHLVDQAWVKEDRQSNPLTLLFETVSRLSTCTASQVLKDPSRVSSFLQAAQLMHSFKNFSGCFALTLGLSMHCVSRLDLGIQGSSKAEKAIFALVDPAQNYAVYRGELEQVAASKTACIPYVGLVTQAVTLIDEGSPTLIDGKVNRDKILLLWDSWEKFSSYQGHSYPLIDDLDAQKKLLDQILAEDLSTEEQLYEMSYAIKPIASTRREGDAGKQ
jgi:hypothetical protein